jgi:CheY-like chemotaxis protein
MLTDIGLPGALSGINLAVIAAERYLRLRIATMTGYAEQAELAEGLAYPLLLKPFRRFALAAAMQTLFKASAAPQ